MYLEAGNLSWEVLLSDANIGATDLDLAMALDVGPGHAVHGCAGLN